MIFWTFCYFTVDGRTLIEFYWNHFPKKNLIFKKVCQQNHSKREKKHLNLPPASIFTFFFSSISFQVLWTDGVIFFLFQLVCYLAITNTHWISISLQDTWQNNIVIYNFSIKIDKRRSRTKNNTDLHIFASLSV